MPSFQDPFLWGVWLLLRAILPALGLQRGSAPHLSPETSRERKHLRGEPEEVQNWNLRSRLASVLGEQPTCICFKCSIQAKAVPFGQQQQRSPGEEGIDTALVFSTMRFHLWAEAGQEQESSDLIIEYLLFLVSVNLLIGYMLCGGTRKRRKGKMGAVLPEKGTWFTSKWSCSSWLFNAAWEHLQLQGWIGFLWQQ